MGNFFRRLGELIQEVVSKRGIMWIASAGNHGPALSTVGTPPDFKHDLIMGKTYTYNLSSVFLAKFCNQHFFNHLYTALRFHFTKTVPKSCILSLRPHKYTIVWYLCLICLKYPLMKPKIKSCHKLLQSEKKV